MIADTYRGTVVDILVSSPLMEVNSRFDLVHTGLHNFFSLHTLRASTHTHTHARTQFLSFFLFFSYADIRTRFYQACHLLLGDRKIVQDNSDSSYMRRDTSNKNKDVFKLDSNGVDI